MIQSEFYSDNIWKQRLWQENVPKISVQHTKGNGRSYPYLYPIGDLTQGSSITASMNALTNNERWCKQ